jgi:hypothetical protein
MEDPQCVAFLKMLLKIQQLIESKAEFFSTGAGKGASLKRSRTELA